MLIALIGVILLEQRARLSGVAAPPSSSSSAVVATGNAVAVAAGYNHTCAITRAGGLKCWGSNSHGQLGNGSTVDSSVPIDVSGLASGVIAIAAGYEHTCALTNAGGVKCWGNNLNGDLGDGTTVDSARPVDVQGMTSGITAIAAGSAWMCALTDAGGVKCWGWNQYGELGNNATVDSAVPVDVIGLTSGVQAIAAGGNASCALVGDGLMKCWGYNGYGGLGTGSTANSDTPVDVAGLSGKVIGMGIGDSTTCAILAARTVKCWGFGGQGQLGNGSTTTTTDPQDVSGLTGVAAISGGETTAPTPLGGHICALTITGSVKCWGDNRAGQLGIGSKTNGSTTPVDVPGLTSGISAISVRGDRTCALTSDGAILCWGANDRGQLGNGTTTDSTVPMLVSGL